MKIDIAIHSCDDNPLYLDFWEPVSKIWKIKFGIIPVLLYFGNKNPSSQYGEIIRISPLKDFCLPLQTLWSRYWYATTLKNKIGIISDIDMLPLSRFYFIDQVQRLENKYLHLNPCAETYGKISSCYHVASGENFTRVLGAFETFNESIKIVSNFGNERDFHSSGWFYDEDFATHKIQSFSDKTLFEFLPRDGGQNGHRIDRSSWGWNKKKLIEDWYYDAHCVRPYSQHKKELDDIVEITIGNK